MAAAALADTLDAVAACRADGKILALDGRLGPWLPPGFEVIAPTGRALAERLANAWSDVGAPGIQIGMDTPQVHAQRPRSPLGGARRATRSSGAGARRRRRLVGHRLGPSEPRSERRVPRHPDEHPANRRPPGPAPTPPRLHRDRRRLPARRRHRRRPGRRGGLAPTTRTAARRPPNRPPCAGGVNGREPPTCARTGEPP